MENFPPLSDVSMGVILAFFMYQQSRLQIAHEEFLSALIRQLVEALIKRE
jgi:hypothetical protein